MWRFWGKFVLRAACVDAVGACTARVLCVTMGCLPMVVWRMCFGDALAGWCTNPTVPMCVCVYNYRVSLGLLCRRAAAAAAAVVPSCGSVVCSHVHMNTLSASLPSGERYN